MTLPVELETSVTQLRAKHTALVQAVNDYRSGTIDASKQELLDMAAALTERLEIEEHTLLGQVARVSGMHPAKLGLLRGLDLRGLFSGGEQGAWYDPSDISTLFQDAEGTTPVTADGDPVGLMLDKSKGLVLGQELVVNEWTARENSTLSIVNGRLRVTAIGAGGYGVDTTVSVYAGRTYSVGFSVVTVSGSLYLGLQGDVVRLSPGDYRRIARSSGDGRFSAALTSGAPGDYFEIDNVSVRELPGNHATQKVSAARPIYKTDGTLHWLEFDGVDDRLESQLKQPTPVSIAASLEMDNPGDGNMYVIGGGYLSVAARGYGIGYYSKGWMTQARTSAGVRSAAVLSPAAIRGVVYGSVDNATGAVTLKTAGGSNQTEEGAFEAVVPADYFAIGRPATSTSPADLKGKVFGVLVTAGVVDFEQIQPYLARKAGVTP